MRPDFDNLLKFVMDGLNGAVCKDNEQVVKLHATSSLTKNDHVMDTECLIEGI
jgi:Holliday junction resolvase RusA-like endonuclease